jgi:hypothetical protein
MKEFVNKLSQELFNPLNIQHTKTSLPHPPCEVEVFNKAIKKYLAYFVDDTTLDWENLLPALMLSYNRSYHSTIATTLFELLFGVKPYLPSFPNHDIQWVHYGKSSSAERLDQLVQKILFLGKRVPVHLGKNTKRTLTKQHFPTTSNSMILSGTKIFPQ